MRRFLLLAVCLCLCVPVGCAQALTRDEAQTRLKDAEVVVRKTVIHRDNGILMWHRDTGYDFKNKDVSALFMIRTHAGRAIPYLAVAGGTLEPLDATVLRATRLSRFSKRSLGEDATVEFQVPSNGVARWMGDGRYGQSITINATINEELDKMGRLAEFCADDRANVVVELIGPAANTSLTLSYLERQGIVGMWKYFTAYAYLAGTYHEPVADTPPGEKNDDGYDARFRNILEELNMLSPEIDEMHDDGDGAAAPDETDTRPQAVTELPLSPQPTDPYDTFERRQALADRRQLLEEQTRVVAEQEKLREEQIALETRIKAAEAEWEKQKKIDEQTMIASEWLIDSYLRVYWEN